MSSEIILSLMAEVDTKLNSFFTIVYPDASINASSVPRLEMYPGPIVDGYAGNVKGIFQITLVVAHGSGSKTFWEAVDRVLNAFPLGTPIPNSDGDIVANISTVPTVATPAYDDDVSRVPITLEWQG